MTKATNAIALSILALLGGGVAACAQSRLPPASPHTAEHRTAEEAGEQIVDSAEPAALAAADAAEAAVDNALTPENNNGTTERKVMDANKEIQPMIPSGPPIPTDLLLNRVLALVNSLHSPHDVSRTQVERIMDVKLVPQPDIERYWDFDGITDAGWTYTVFVKESAIGELPVINVYFPVGDVERGENPSVCTHELESFAEKLVPMGYFRSPGWKQPRGFLAFDRQAKGSRFSVGVHLFKYVQQTGPKEDDYRYCVSSLRIMAGESVDGE